MRPRDPRIRQRINQISHNIESANETAQESIYTFSHNYVSPCLGAVGHCISACTAPCLPSKADQLRRRRRGRAEANFDFYDDWDNDIAGDGILGWSHGELDRLLAGSGLSRGGSASEQPCRQRAMSYGTRNTRRKNSTLTPDNRHDPTVIPSSSFLGFLERFPWRLGAKGLKYHPSAADLQEHPRGLLTRHGQDENEPLMEAAGNDEEEYAPYQDAIISDDEGNRRKRSGTNSSRETDTSLSSRGDLIPSDDEEDAVPLDDDLAAALARRGVGFDADDVVLGDKMSTSGTVSLATASSKGSRRKGKRKSTRKPSSRTVDSGRSSVVVDLREEERQAELEQESEIKEKRLAAQKLAVSRGLHHESYDKVSAPKKKKEGSL